MRTAQAPTTPIPTPAKKQRPCLRCDQPFWSEGPYNCLCKTCRAYNHANTSAEVFSLRGPRAQRPHR